MENTVEVVFQVNGKVRAKASVAKDMDKAALEKLAMDNDRVKEFMIIPANFEPRVRC